MIYTYKSENFHLYLSTELIYGVLIYRYLQHILLIKQNNCIKPLNAKLNPICYLLELLGAHRTLYVSRIRVNSVGRVAQSV